MDVDFNNNMGHLLNRMILGEESVDKYDEFLKEYGQKSDEELFVEIDKIQKEVPDGIKSIHLRNLDRLARMEGFVDSDTIDKIDYVKKIIKVEESSNRRYSGVNVQYFGGTSLLLWFLLLTVLFRRPRFRRGHRRGHRRIYY
ncbi:hypothetical protein GOQ29_03225 [Clostridium sp. D2Q-14]|uniref:hypothetical protein n=1 Tax=Anaeromonas gelatinilytica TaxID=2683194 RepID=UPI00193B895D|nr:hypothetical protein [Anaeromonas gelatinilytica]MBS4534621.1 hypothetical protein [Anaeromonas gelatinilytica]